MKFVCERCHTKYSIADDKVRQKILKIRCKTCENVITIRDAVVVSEAGPQRAAPPPAPGLNAPRSVEWHLAVNGRQEGPLGLAALVTRILGAGRGDEVYVWNEHLDGWKEPKLIPEVAAEMRARAAASVPPLPPGVRRPPTPAAGRAHLPPPGGTGRSSASMPAVSARASSGSRGGGAAAAAAYAPISEQEELGEKTQISSLDAALLAPEAAPAPARSGRHPAVPTSFPALADLSVSLPLPGSSASNGSSARPLPGGSGLEGLDFVPVPVAASGSGAKRSANLAAAPGAGVVSAPVVGGSTSMLLSQIGGRVARVRHPAIKYVITGGVLVALIIVVAVLSMTGGEKKLGENRPAVAATNPTGGTDPEAVARAEAEKYFKSMVGEGPAQAGTGTAKSVGPPRRHTPPPRGRPAGADNTKPPPVAPPPVGTAPPAVDGVGVARRFAGEERRVAAPGKKESQPSGAKASFDHGKFMAVFKQQDHYQAIKSCYDRALKRDQKLRLGRLDITVGVGETGSVRQVGVEAPSEFAAVSTCIRTTVRRWRFPPTGENYEATFTMLLHGSTE